MKLSMFVSTDRVVDPARILMKPSIPDGPTSASEASA